MNPLTNRRRLLATSILALPIMAGPALAAKPSASDTNGIPEIVVTAQRTSQSLLSVPIAIVAQTGEQLKEAGIRGLSGIEYTTPGIVVANSTGYQQIFVRGVGNSVYVGADPSVATYVDDIPRIYGSLVNSFINVDRIEMLKGAQGGLYGRNATGGVVNIITHQPSTEKFEAKLLLGYGEKNTFKAQGYVNVPVNDKVAFSVGADRETHDAYIKNVAPTNPYSAANFPAGSFLGSPAQTAAFFNSTVRPQNNLNNQNFWSVDGKVLFKPSDNLKITFAADYSEKKDTEGMALVQLTPAFPAGTHQALMAAYGFQPTPGFYQTSAGKFTSAKGDHVKQTNTDYGASVTAVLNLNGFDLTAISAARAQRPGEYDELTDLNVNVIGTDIQHHLWFYYEELRAVSNGEGPFHWLGGATYLYDHFYEQLKVNLVPFIPLGFGFGASTDARTIVKNWTVYAQVGYDITPNLNLTVSGRYVHETNQTSFLRPTAETDNAVEKKFVPSANLSYKFEGGGNAYIRWARGFKTGGVNPVSPTSLFPGGIGGVFGPETVDTFETGYRAPLFDRTVQVTSAIFYNNYKNLQVSATAQPTHPEIIYAIVNAGTARTYGAELTVDWKVADPLTLGASGAWLNAKYKRFSIPNGPILAPFDHSNTHMNLAPRLQLAFTAQLDQPINDQYRLVGNLLVSHISRVVFAQSPSPAILPDAGQDGYWMTNLRLGVKTSDDKYSVSVYAKNLFNKLNYTYGGTSLGSGAVLQLGDPRIIGGEISVNF